jgi:hypothetical protein
MSSSLQKEIIIKIRRNRFLKTTEYYKKNPASYAVAAASDLEDLRSANLRGADLNNIVLANADLDGTLLEDANLNGANLNGANLSNASFSNHTSLSDANLINANLSGDDLSGVNLYKAKLSNANLTKTKFTNANLSGADLSGADLTGADLTGANLTEAIFTGTIIIKTIFSPNALSSNQQIQTTQEFSPNALNQQQTTQKLPQRIGRLEEINKLIRVFDYIEGVDMPVNKYFTENRNKAPYIVVNKISDGYVYSPNGIRLIPDNTEFVECDKDTPVDWQGNSYKKFIKQPKARHFIRIYINGVSSLVLKPYWFDSGIVPGTRFFKLTEEEEPLFKYMSLDLSKQILAPDFSALGANHCNQTQPQQTYKLEPLNLKDLEEMISSSPNAGGTKRKKQSKTKRKNSRKQSKTKRKNSRKQSKTKRRKGKK